MRVAPALALVDLGIVMGAAGVTGSSETAGAVITVDRIHRVADAVHTGCRSLQIARQSVLAGTGLSLAAMGVAAAGYLPRRRRGDSRRSSCGSHRVLIEQWCNRRMSESPRVRWVVRR